MRKIIYFIVVMLCTLCSCYYTKYEIRFTSKAIDMYGNECKIDAWRGNESCIIEQIIYTTNHNMSDIKIEFPSHVYDNNTNYNYLVDDFGDDIYVKGYIDIKLNYVVDETNYNEQINIEIKRHSHFSNKYFTNIYLHLDLFDLNNYMFSKENISISFSYFD